MPNSTERKARIHYARVDEFWHKEQKYAYLEEKQHVGNVEWHELQPDAKGNWLTVGMQDEFDAFLPIGSKKAKAAARDDATTIFKNYGRGVATTRDAWAYNFGRGELEENIRRTIQTYNEHVYKWAQQKPERSDVDSFVSNDDTRISWSEGLKNSLARGLTIEYQEDHIRHSLYRPFTTSFLYFDGILNERRYQFPAILPVAKLEEENLAICLSGIGSNKPFHCLLVNLIPSLDLLEKTQCFPFYTYNEDGTNRRENITDWALEEFRSHYNDKSITKWDIFHYVYALLHHPLYRERYAANLKRELPRIPFAPDFRAFVDIGKRLAEIHVNYEQQPEYPLEKIETPGKPLDWRVEKMKLSKDKRSLIYNDFLTLSGIPPEAFEYRLGNRSALEWIIDQHQVSTDKRSSITNDPNRVDDPQYVLLLIAQVITASIETVTLVQSLAQLNLVNSESSAA